MFWMLPPDLQQRLEDIQNTTKRLQQELGIEPRTLEQRYQDYLKHQAEEQRRQEELKKLQAQIGKHRPLPKWKV